MNESSPRVYRVGEVLAGLNRMLEDRVGRLWVVGEISDLRQPGSGHLYFSLVDEDARLRAALFRGNARRLLFDAEEGLEVLAYGELSVYGPRGDLQLIVRQLEPRGVGALQLAFEQLRRRLEAEGLFDPAHKRRLPSRPTQVGVVTSLSGAALRDVLAVTGRRQPGLPVCISPTRVQGEGAEHEIAEALDLLVAHPGVSVVLLVRGGGSPEDLQPFNTEVVARAIGRAQVPVVSGVGHEVDVTIADLVADARAATPSAAAELAVPDRDSLASEVERSWRRLRRAFEVRVDAHRARFDRHRESLRAQAPAARLAAHRERWSAAHRALLRAGAATPERPAAHLATRAGRLHTLSPLAVLGRGYALVRRRDDGGIVRDEADARPGDALRIRLARAELDAVVDAVHPLADDPGSG